MSAVGVHGTPAPDTLSRTVLLVDDDADMRLYLRGCLRHLTPPVTRVVESGDGLEALHLLRNGAVDLVISDIRLPGLDGRRLSRAIRDDATLDHVTVLLIGGDQDAGADVADGFLPKPFNGAQLLAAVAALDTRRETRTRNAS